MMNVKAIWAKHVEPSHLDWTYRLLESLYTEPHRAYHTLTHVRYCLELRR